MYEMDFLLPVFKADGFQWKLQHVLAKEARVGAPVMEAQPLPNVSVGDAIHPAGY